MKVVIDSWAWMEMFKGTLSGSKVRRIIEDARNEVLTTAANYYEVYYSIEQQYGRQTRVDYLASIKSTAKILDIVEKNAELAAELRLKTGLRALDAFTLSAAQIAGAKLVTGDAHFSRFKDEIILI